MNVGGHGRLTLKSLTLVEYDVLRSMLLKDFLPNPVLRDFVQCYRIVHFKFDKADHIPFKAYPPKPEECLHFFLLRPEAVDINDCGKKEYQQPIILLGQQTSIYNRYFPQEFLNFQIVFQPTGLYRLTGIPSYEITNQYVEATSIFSKKILFTLEQLQQAISYREMLNTADSFVTNVIKQARKDLHPVDKATKQMMQCKGNISIDYLAKESFLCVKQFKRKFYERAGVNPKTYTRIIRFNKAFNLKNRYPCMDWLRIAIECGYFDYQHLVKDYKDFTGLTPNEFHVLERNSPECVLGLAFDVYRSRT